MTDILLDDINELSTVNGDFAIGESDSQHIRHLLEAMKGHYRHNPVIGANIKALLNGSDDIQDKVNEVQSQLEGDGFGGLQVTLDGEVISIKEE